MDNVLDLVLLAGEEISEPRGLVGRFEQLVQARFAQVAIQQQGGVAGVEGDRCRKISGNEATAAVGRRRGHQQHEVAIAGLTEQARPQVAEGIRHGRVDRVLVDDAPRQQVRATARKWLAHMRNFLGCGQPNQLLVGTELAGAPDHRARL